MEQRDLWKNITGTAFVLGLTLSTMSINSTQLIGTISDAPIANYDYVDEQAYNSTNTVLYSEARNVYVENKTTHLEAEVESLFGKMRVATAEESASVNNYIRSISKDTGVNFFNLC